MLSRMTLAVRMLAALFLAAAMLVAVGLSAWVGARGVTGRLGEQAELTIPALQALAQLHEAQLQVASGVHAALISQASIEDHRRAIEKVTHGLVRVDAAAKAFGALPHGAEDAQLWDRWKKDFGGWREGVGRTVATLEERDLLADAGRPPGDPELAVVEGQAWKAYQAGERLLESAFRSLEGLKKAAKDGSTASAHAGMATASRLTNAIALSTGLAASLLVALALLLARGMRRTVSRLVAETSRLRDAVTSGELATRGDQAALDEEFRSVIAGMNQVMDAYARPIQVTQECVIRISRGDIPPKIADSYEGDFNQIKEALNRCIDAVSLLVADAASLSRAAVEGKLSSRADASKHQGDFQKVVAGVNATLDAVLAPIDEARGVLERLAQRDLTARVRGSYQGDHAAIKEALNTAAGALHDALGQVAESVEQVSRAAGQIASSSQAVASGASEQASSLEETHSSLESMSAQTREAADSAQQADGLAAATRRSAEEGASAMEQMTTAMARIRRSAEGTSAIIRDISEIAFQTNLLALNAAVEAARAGEAGRGFAVVAEEVRSLALRAKEAAVKTEGLIQDSVRQATEGEAVAKLSSEKLVEIVGSIQKVSDIVAEIAASSKQQALGIEQVNRAVGEVDKVTQQNAASSEASSSVAEKLSGQSEELATLVGTFQISRSEDRPTATARAHAPRATARGAVNGSGAASLGH